VNAPDWDALAPHWEHFEDGGLNREIFAGLKLLVRPPLLYVGSGRGGLAARVARLSVDRSFAMCQHAHQDHGIACVAADAAHLPLRSGCFATVLCATGVLEFLSHSERVRVLAELGRVCGPDGQVLAFAACGDSGVHWGVNQHALVRAWFAGRVPMPAFDAVAAGDREAARDMLLASLPQRGQSVSSEELAAAAADAGMKMVEAHVGNDGIGRWRLVVERP
jgi:SAM-dependent methyltransferase